VGDFGRTLEAAVIVLNRKFEDDLKELRRQMQERFVLVIDLLAQDLHKLLFKWPIGQCQWGHSQHVC
jgi:hypothetical protein